MAVGMGRDSWASTFPEAVYGAASAGTETYFRIISETMKMDQPVKVSKSLQGASPRITYQGNKNVGGGLVIELNYQGQGQLIRHAMGGYAFTGSSPGAGAQLHTMTLADAIFAGTGLTVEISKANIPSGKVFQYLGCKVNAMELAFEQDESVIATFDLIAQTENSNVTASATPTYVAYHPVLWRHTGTLTLAGTSSLEFVKGKIRLDNKLRQRFLMHDTTREPLRDDLREVSGEFTIEFENLTLFDKFVTPGTGTFALTYTSTEMITGAYPYLMIISMPKIQLQTPQLNINTAGIVEATYPFISLHDGTSTDQLTIALNNAETTLA